MVSQSISALNISGRHSALVDNKLIFFCADFSQNFFAIECFIEKNIYWKFYSDMKLIFKNFQNVL